MLSTLFDSARRSFRRHDKRNPSHSRIGASSGASRSTADHQRQVWRRYNGDVDDDDSEDDHDADLTEPTDDAALRRLNARSIDENEHSDDEEHVPLLPIFEASHLDSLPVYSLTHAIRLLVIPKCETTLSWDQLRSPQVSQFLVKPIQKEIMENHFSKATVYALIANCLQFIKEAEQNPAIVGMSKTRAMVCELLAIRALKEYSVRELIDVLSYDFYPLQGMAELAGSEAQKRPQAARTSTLEVAIRASAKRFLAHPTVVQQLEAIWAGTIVFHHAADAAHRAPRQISRLRRYGTIQSGTTSGLLTGSVTPINGTSDTTKHLATRRTVTLYDPKEASLFKLSRLRVPRYRHFLSTCSLAVFLGLFLAVLTTRSVKITSLEIVFWFWSAGFMLDEVVGFNEQGFSLYIMSIWNAFDIGILLLLICFYALRLYSVLLLGSHKQNISNIAFDVLAANAVLLFPRLFSILDHYRYFSQLLIAFRMMAQDLVAVFILIAISCSGFFVAFTLSFGNDAKDPGKTAFSLYQMLMGFTPTAWELWEQYNMLGRTLLVLFMLITHFLIVTILVTVLTNSFTAIVQNAHDEHQFVFAVNTISMVKSDSLFSYIAPSNILGWLLTPMRYLVPFRQFVSTNRMVIKFTHMPILFSIFAYERLVLQGLTYEPIEEVVSRGRQVRRLKSFDPIGSGMMMFSPREPKLREPSMATFHKDRALAEVFRRPFQDNSGKTEKQRKKLAAVDNWMLNMGPDAEVSPPDEQDSDVLDRLERPRRSYRKTIPRRFTSAMSFATRSIAASDPEDVAGGDNIVSRSALLDTSKIDPASEDLLGPSDHDGDDELISNDDTAEQVTIGDHGSTGEKENSNTPRPITPQRPRLPLRSLTTPNSLPMQRDTSLRTSSISWAETSPVRYTPQARMKPGSRPMTSRRASHRRNLSTQTVLFNPTNEAMTVSLPQITTADYTSNIPIPSFIPAIKAVDSVATAAHHRDGSLDNMDLPSPSRLNIDTGSSKSPKSPMTSFMSPNKREMNHIKETSSMFSPSPPPSSAPDRESFRGGGRGIPVPYARNASMALDLASDLGDNKAAMGAAGGDLSASFATQMAFADRIRRMRSQERHDDDRRMNKLMLARMGVLEQGFREVLKEVKELREAESKRKKRIRIAGITGIAASRRNSKVNTGASSEMRSDDGGSIEQEAQWVDQDVHPDGRGSSI